MLFRSPEPDTPVIRLEDLSVTYPGGVEALRGIDLTIDDGEFVVVVGLSGAGKSTLLRVLNGLVPATSGSVIVEGTQVVGASPATLRQIRSGIGMIFQTFNLVNRTTVLNNVLMGRLSVVPAWRSTLGLWPAEDREAAMVALERVGIVEKAYVRASNLSGGQQQRVGIARALAQEPGLVLADEPVVDEIEGELKHALGGRAPGVDLRGPLQGYLLEVRMGDHGVDHAHVEGLLGGVVAAQEEDPPGTLLPNPPPSPN